MVWSLETDDFHGSCGEGVDPLLTSIRKELNGGDPDPPTPGTTTTTTLDPTASTTVGYNLRHKKVVNKGI